jgi:hypothetical protein
VTSEAQAHQLQDGHFTADGTSDEAAPLTVDDTTNSE